MAEGTDTTGTEAPSFDEAWSIWQRVNAVMRAVGFVGKDNVHEIRKDGKKVGEFMYVSHDDVTAAIRPACIAYGIAVMPTVTEHQKDGNRTELVVETNFINIHNPDDKITIKTYGYGVDSSDKGPGKALSYAVKYAYMKLFMLNSNDDIEQHDIKHDPQEMRASQLVETELAGLEAQQAWAKTFKTALESAETPEAIDRLQKENKKMLQSVPETTREYFIELIQSLKNDMQEAA